MGWAIGERGGRDIGYGVPAVCDYPDCNEEIDRGLSYCCGGFISDDGCGLYFCGSHLYYAEDIDEEWHEFCDSCAISTRLNRMDPNEGWRLSPEGYEPKPDILKWVLWKKYDASWQQWRNETPKELIMLDQRIAEADPTEVNKLMAELEPQMEQNQRKKWRRVAHD